MFVFFLFYHCRFDDWIASKTDYQVMFYAYLTMIDENCRVLNRYEFDSSPELSFTILYLVLQFQKTNKTTSRDWCEPLSQVQLSVLIEVTDQLSKQSIQSQPISLPQSFQLLSQTSIVQLCARIHCEIICHRKNPKSPHPFIPAVRERFLIAGPRDFGTALEFVLFSRHQKQGPSSVPGFSGARCQMKFSSQRDSRCLLSHGSSSTTPKMVTRDITRERWDKPALDFRWKFGVKWTPGFIFLVRNEHLKISISPHIAPASKSPKCKKICQPANKRRIGRLHFFWPGLLLPDLGWSGPTQEYPRRVVVCKQREENAGRMKFVGTDPIWCESVRVLELCWNSGNWSFFLHCDYLIFKAKSDEWKWVGWSRLVKGWRGDRVCCTNKQSVSGGNSTLSICRELRWGRIWKRGSFNCFVGLVWIRFLN